MPVTLNESPTNPPSNPPAGRRPHTKSRKGCATCKRRHIRCDQKRPQCGNCQKHNVPCPYLNDVNLEASQSPEAETGPPRLEISEQIERDVEAWKNSGAAPFPALTKEYSKADLRLMYHISVICAQMRNAESQEQSIWVQRVPLFLRLATEHEFVMHALLALAASHLSWSDMYQADLSRSYYHRAMALKTLPQEVGELSRENADAVLAASILLAWQETEWADWRNLMHGIRAVVGLMQGWRHKSQFYEYIEEVESFMTAPPSRPTRPEDDIRWLNYIFVSLTRLEPYFQGRREEANGLNDLKDFLRNLAAHVPIHSDEAQFALLHPLRIWLMFLPISFAKKAQQDPDTMVLLAHFYAVALAIEPLFPAVGAAYFGSMALGPIRKLHEILFTRAQHDPMAPRWPIQMMAFPLEMSREFCWRMGWKRADEVEEDSEMDGMNTHFMHPPSPSNSGFGSSDGSNPTQIYHPDPSNFLQPHFVGLEIQPMVDEEFYRGAIEMHDGVEEQRMLYRG